MELIDIIMTLKVDESISISKIQIDNHLGYLKAKALFDELINKGLIILDKNKDRYTYNPIRYRHILEEKYGNLSSLISAYDGKRKLNLPEGMKKDEFIKLIIDQGKGMNIIFLDIDGVLNCSTTIDKCGPYRGIEDNKVLLLKKLVDECHAKIVLISSWKEKWFKYKQLKFKQDLLANYLDEKMAHAHFEINDKVDPWLTRPNGIWFYLCKARMRNIVINNYVIFDDTLDEYKEHTRIKSHLLLTDFNNDGLTKKHINAATKILAKPLDANRFF